MFRKVKSRTNLRQRFSSGDEDDGGGVCRHGQDLTGAPVDNGNGGRVVATGVRTDDGISVPMQQQQQPQQHQRSGGSREEKVIKEARLESSVVTKEHSLLSFDNLEGDDVVDFKIKRKDPSRRMEKFARRLRKDVEHLKEEEVAEVETNEIPGQSTSSPSANQEESCEEKTARYNENDTETAEDSFTRKKFTLSYKGQIPDAKTVYEARKKREKMRLSRSDGYIPLDDVQRAKDKSIARSRLVREDENDMSDEDLDDGRFYSSKNMLADEEQRRRDQHYDFLATEQGDNEDDEHSDDELSRWEREQIKKGVSSSKVEMFERERAKIDAMMREIKNNMIVPNENRDQLPMEMDIDVSEPAVVTSHAGKVTGRTSVISFGAILENVRQRNMEGEQALNAREAELKRVNEQIEENRESLAKLESEDPRIRECFQVYQGLGEIKELEDRFGSVMSTRALKLKNRRRKDVHDTYDECSAAAAGRSLAAPRSTDVTQRAAEREARRARRRRERENTLAGISHEEGLSTDDEEMKSEIVVREQTIREISQMANTVFDDVIDDFCRIDRILAKFLDWLSVDEQSFTNAYVHLCIPKLISLFIRLELIDWDPLEIDDRPLNSMQWYDHLVRCGTDNVNVDYEHPLIIAFIPLCIEKVVLWKINDIVRDRWDPLSQRHCKFLSQLLDQLLKECPTLTESSKPVQRLLQTLFARAQDSIDEDLFIPLYSKQAVENIATGCKSFLDRQYWTAIKLIRCLQYFSKIFSEERLKELILDGIVNRSAVLALQCSVFSDASMVRKCRALVKAIPATWWAEANRGAIRSLKALLPKVILEHKENRSVSKNALFKLINSQTEVWGRCNMDWSRVSVVIERFARMAKTSLRELHQLQRVILECSEVNDWSNVVAFKREASQKMTQLSKTMHEVLELRSHLSGDELKLFDSRFEPLRLSVQAAIDTLNKVILATVEIVEDENIYDRLYEHSLISQNDCLPESSAKHQKQLQDDSLKFRLEEAKINADETKRLASEIEDLNEVMLQLGELIHAQHEVVDSIEEHIERANFHVSVGHTNLKKAQAAQSAKYPLIAAAIGGVAVGGPIGVAAGSAITGVCAALGGVVAGLYSGRYFRKKAQQAANQKTN